MSGIDFSVFTLEDIDAMIEAMDAWIVKDTGPELMLSMLEGMVAKDASPAEKAEIQAEREKARAETKREAAIRRESATIIKAKLIAQRRKMLNDPITEVPA